jgi:dihydropteroate synthase
VHSIYQNKSHSPLIMGILNITPDSFSDGSQYNTVDQAFERAHQMQQAGVDIIDIGGESTRPGAADVSAEQEIERVVPVINRIKKLGIPISIDTSKPQVMQAAVAAGAMMINDVRALSESNALQMAAKLKVPVCLMHMQGQPRSMQKAPEYKNVVQEVISFLRQRVKACENAGIDKSLISLDPGFGFGKSLPHNLKILDQLERLVELGFPVLAGLSRKSMLGEITNKPVEQRLSASLAVAQLAMQKGARIIRVHDVAETVDVRQVFMAMKELR